MARRLILSLNRVTEKLIPLPNDAILLSEKVAIKVGWITQFQNSYSTKYPEVQSRNSSYTRMGRTQISGQHTLREKTLPEGHYGDEAMQSKTDNGGLLEDNIGKNVSKQDKIKFLVNTLLGLKESKEAVYGALDAWVAWEQRFPLASLRTALATLEKEQEWHKVIQIIKWILSKGQGNTMGVYRQLINALDMDHRAEEAHNFWMKKIGCDLHSVPWTLCARMISIYYRNNMPERLVKLFKGLEAFDRKPPDKLVVQKVADAYEILGLVEQKSRVMEKYNYLFTETWGGHPKKYKKASQKDVKKSDERNQRTSNHQETNPGDAQTTSSDKRNTMDDAKVTTYNQQSNKEIVIDKVLEMVHK